VDTLSTVQRLIAEEAEVDVKELGPNRPLEELGVDSLRVLEVMFKLEDIFGVEMPEERVPIRTVQDVVDLVDHLLARKAASSG
jgi:acyl carrier protein